LALTLSAFISSAFAFPLIPIFFRFVRWRQELEGRARERYGALDRLDAELSWYLGQYNALDALVVALTTPNRWLVYRQKPCGISPRSWTPRLRRMSPRSRG
jgi:hypothetical protein